MAYKRVIIIGGGFGGLTAARSIRHADVTLIDRTNHHLFQPLLYQVATTALSPGDIAWPLRTLFRSQRNVRVMMDDVVSLDRAARMVYLQNSSPIAFDILIVASGSRHAYFGHDEWESSAPGLKTMADAVQLREKMLLAFEDAERRRTSTGVQRQLTFVIVGGGPTGVELAGALAELGRKTMGPDFPSLRLEDFVIMLVEAGPRILPGFDAELSAKAAAALTFMGVMIKLGSPVSAVHADGVRVGQEWIPSTNVIWAAGNQASPLLNTLSAPQDSFGRIKVRPDLTIPDDPWIFVIGDAAHSVGHDKKPLPGVAPVAIQQGRYVANLINRDVAPDQRPLFVYADRGMLATIGRAQAVAQFGSVRASGLVAWLLWCVVHIFFLISFRSRFRVMSEWVWYYLTFKPGARLIFVQPATTHSRPSTDHARK
ncbi:MAG: NAD(P)/FAD-dependent oxidoreductase [Nitrospira sp.]|nr:MAG: NAD(P)/FAD-dependent oxidoreductase [Nitrospira sp.]